MGGVLSGTGGSSAAGGNGGCSFQNSNRLPLCPRFSQHELQYAQKVWGDSAAVQATLAWIRHRQGLQLSGRERFDSLRGAINMMKRVQSSAVLVTLFVTSCWLPAQNSAWKPRNELQRSAELARAIADFLDVQRGHRSFRRMLNH